METLGKILLIVLIVIPWVYIAGWRSHYKREFRKGNAPQPGSSEWKTHKVIHGFIKNIFKL